MTEQYRFPKWLFAEKKFTVEWSRERPHFFVLLTGNGAQACGGHGDSIADAAKNARKAREEKTR